MKTFAKFAAWYLVLAVLMLLCVWTFGGWGLIVNVLWIPWCVFAYRAAWRWGTSRGRRTR